MRHPVGGGGRGLVSTHASPESGLSRQTLLLPRLYKAQSVFMYPCPSRLPDSQGGEEMAFPETLLGRRKLLSHGWDPHPGLVDREPKGGSPRALQQRRQAGVPALLCHLRPYLRGH